MKIALIHDWLTGMRGGEKCLEVFCEQFPDATLMTLLHVPGSVSATIEKMNIQTSWIQKMPGVAKYYRHYLPLFPTAIEEFDLREYDLVLSSSHCVAKGVLVHPETQHVCYCHTPMRYVWSMYQDYFGPARVRGLSRFVIALSSNYLRMWDVLSAQRVHYFIANSQHVRRRIQHYYQREAEVIYPPVDLTHTQLATPHDDYYLIVSALVPYKRIELAIAAFNQLNRRLVIVGTGGEAQRLKKMTQSKQIEFVGWASGAELQKYYAGCRALIFPGEEDFGIVPVEAQAYGKPVIAFARGGARETVAGIMPAATGQYPRPSASTNATGVFFQASTASALVAAILQSEKIEFDAATIRAQAQKFDRAVFRAKIQHFLSEKSGIKF